MGQRHKSIKVQLGKYLFWGDLFFIINFTYLFEFIGITYRGMIVTKTPTKPWGGVTLALPSGLAGSLPARMSSFSGCL